MAGTTARLRSRNPWLRPLLLAAPALAIYLLPCLGQVLVYDRSAILAGEVWRLVTGHWVHFSASHLVCDVAVLVVTGGLCEKLGDRHFPRLCLVSAAVIGLSLLLFLPELARYGGLSGVAMAATVYLGLAALQKPGAWHRFGLGLLLLVAGKFVLDGVLGHFLLVTMARGSVVPVPLSHLTGALCGLLAHRGLRLPGVPVRNGKGWLRGRATTKSGT